MSVRRRVFRRVVEQVHEYLDRRIDVAVDGQRRLRQVHLESVPVLLQQRTAGLDRARENVVQVDRAPLHAEAAARHAIDVEQLVDDARELHALPVDGLAHRFEHRIAHALASHERHGIADRRQRIAQFVREHRDELVGAMSRVGERFGVATLGEILRHHVVRARRAVRLAQRRDDVVGPVTGAVAPHAPALRRAPAQLARRDQVFPRFVGEDFFLWIEARKMFAHDVRGRVTAHLGRAVVPVCDESFLVDRDDGVVDHAFDEQAESFLARPQCVLVAPSLGEIARDLGEPDQPSVRITQRGEHDVRPEARAVLANAPAFLLEAAFGHRGCKFVLRMAAVDRVARVELREMRADDFIGGVSLDVLRALVPGRHTAIRIEHEYRVIAHALDERAESRFARAHRFFGLAPLRQVARHLGETDEFAGRIPQRGDHDVCPEPRTVLADAPALILETADLPRHDEFTFGQSTVQRFLRIEAREVFADDLVGGVSLDRGGAGIPAHDVAVGVEHDQCVVAH